MQKGISSRSIDDQGLGKIKSRSNKKGRIAIIRPFIKHTSLPPGVKPPPWWPSDRQLLALHTLDLDTQPGHHVEAFRFAIVDAEIGAVEFGGGVGAAYLALQGWIDGAFEGVDFQVERLADAVQGEGAHDFHRYVAFEAHRSAFVGRCRKFTGIQDFRRHHVLVERGMAGADRGGVDLHIHGAGLGGAVHDDHAFRLGELAAPGRHAAMVGFKAGIGMAGIEVISRAGGKG